MLDVWQRCEYDSTSRTTGFQSLPFSLGEVSKYRVISGPYFPVFGLNTEIYGVNLHIQSEYRKIRTRNNSVFGHFLHSFLNDYQHPKIHKGLLRCPEIYVIHFHLFQAKFNDKFFIENIEIPTLGHFGLLPKIIFLKILLPFLRSHYDLLLTKCKKSENTSDPI